MLKGSWEIHVITLHYKCNETHGTAMHSTELASCNNDSYVCSSVCDPRARCFGTYKWMSAILRWLQRVTIDQHLTSFQFWHPIEPSWPINISLWFEEKDACGLVRILNPQESWWSKYSGFWDYCHICICIFVRVVFVFCQIRLCVSDRLGLGEWAQWPPWATKLTFFCISIKFVFVFLSEFCLYFSQFCFCILSN